MDAFLDFAVQLLRQEHVCEVIVLYGSRARGEENPESDYDLLAFRTVHHGRVLLDKDGIGERLIARIDEIMAGKPEPIAADQLQLRRVWYEKTLKRIERGDAEGNYRRAMLLMNATEDYFDFRNLWVLGPRLSFSWLRENDPRAYATFEIALKPGASSAELRALVDAVVLVTAPA